MRSNSTTALASDRTTVSAVALLWLLGVGSGHAATIVVDGSCTLVDAIAAANTDAPTGACPAGDPGPDTIELDATTLLSAVDNDADGASGTLSVVSEITIEGDGRSASR